ncbi:unnamed protein product, partial [Lymnaea stagnalis]
REATQEEIDGLCTEIREILSVPDKSLDCCGLLRQLFVILQASEATSEPCIPQGLVNNMLQILNTVGQQRSPGAGNRCILCHMILYELLPSDSHSECLNQILAQDGLTINLSSIIIMQDICSHCVKEALPNGVRWLQSQDFEKQKSGLLFVSAVLQLHGDMFDINLMTDVNEKMAQWLSNANLLQAPNPYAINRFRKDVENAVTEIDGTANTSIFTALSVGQYYTEDQFMNVFSFSVLFKWLLGVSKTVLFSAEQTEASDDQQVAVFKHAFGSLIPKAVDYCLRVIEQCERKAKALTDTELQTACLIESVQVLNVICSLDNDQTARIFQEVKRLNTRITQENPASPALIYILKFFFHHSSSVVHDPQETFRHYFIAVISSQFKDQGLMYDTVDFIYNNLAQLAETTDTLTDFFPNLFKILAWHPRIFMNEFAFFLPAMMNWETSVEIFHLLLDLPCMTAALEVMERSKKLDSSLSVSMDVDPSTSLEAFNSPRFRPLFNYITRCESHQGDTIDRLTSLHSVLKDCMSSTRVMVCCQLVPVLLKIWFETVRASNDSSYIALLIPVIIDRSGILYGVPELIQDVHKIFAKELLNLCKAFPDIVTLQKSDITEFLQTTANMAGRLEIYTNLIFAVGEYSAQSYCSDCTSDVIGKYYECLEVITYELLAQLCSTDHDVGIPKVVSVLMSALAKLASRSHDLIPRAILCLTKVAKQQNLILLNTFTREFLTQRATSLIALLKNPE